jgi:hypothetical protein
MEMFFSLMLVGCSGKEAKISATLNREALVTGELPTNPLQWRVITSNANSTDKTMSTLFGNDAAVNYARTNAQHDYPNGSALAMVTWTQQEDRRWYGAQIPAGVKSVEFVFVSATADGQPSYSYQKFAGTPLKKSFAQEYPAASDRALELLSQRPAVMP